MKIRDKEKKILSDVFLKTGEYILALVVLGQAISQKFDLFLFLTGLLIFIVLVTVGIFISSFTKEE